MDESPETTEKETVSIESDPELQEKLFGVDEMFVSRTDDKGIILSGNDLFVSISGYEREQLIQAPHNIIRHKDMPKCIFRLFWKKIQAGENIVAYVKNRAIDGRFYWVVATVFPVAGGYISIRFRPTSELKDKVAALYAEILEYEKLHGIDAALNLLQKHLKEMGFANYEDFMLHILITEYNSRDQKLADISLHSRGLPSLAKPSIRMRRLYDMHSSTFESAQTFALTCSDLVRFVGFREHCLKQTQEIAAVCNRLENLSVNMAITAHKLGNEGGTLSVIASNFQTAAEKMLSRFKQFEAATVTSTSQVNTALSNVLCLRLQTELLTFYFKEVILAQHTNGESGPQVWKEIWSELRILIDELSVLFQKAVNENTNFLANINDLYRNTKSLHEHVMLLDLIRVGGSLEGSRTGQTISMFKPFINEMARFVKNVEQPVSDLLWQSQQLRDALLVLNSQSKRMEHTIQQLKSHWEALDQLSLGLFRMSSAESQGTDDNEDANSNALLQDQQQQEQQEQEGEVA